MSRKARIGHLSGRAKLTPKFRHQAEVLHGKGFALSIDAMVEDAVAVDALASLLDRAFSAALSKDGRLDLREAAMFVIREMRASQHMMRI